MRKLRLEYFYYKHRGRKPKVTPETSVTIVDNKTGIAYTGSPLPTEPMRESLGRHLGMKDAWGVYYYTRAQR